MSGALPLRERASRKFSKLHKSLTKPVCGTANRKLHRRCNHGSPPARTILQRVLKEYSPRLPRSALAALAAIDPADPIPYQFHAVAVDDRSRQRRHLAAAAVRDTIEQHGPLRAGGAISHASSARAVLGACGFSPPSIHRMRSGRSSSASACLRGRHRSPQQRDARPLTLMNRSE